MFARMACTFCLTATLLQAAVAQEAKPPAAQAREPIFDVGEIEVPEGDVNDLLEFLDEITQLQQNIATDYQKAMTKISAARNQASSQVLNDADNLTDEQFAKAASFALATRVRGITQASKEEQREILDLVKRQLSIGVKKGLQRTDFSNASMTASYLERYGDASLAAEAYQDFANLLKDAKNPAYRQYAERFEGSARRLSLLGNPIELEGKLVDGSDFDWDKYKGKVVLVDFWATWCGPCIAEAPNVRRNYDQYHDLGFEVVGISLDRDRSALEAYLEKENVPWENLFENGAGWNHPMARRYGVSSIPSVFLVNREGDVVSLNARGTELGNQLRKLFSSKSDYEKLIALYNEQITPETTDAELILKRAAAYVATDQWDKAKSDWLRAIEINPELYQRAFYRYRTAERFGETADFGLKWIDLKPEDAFRYLAVTPYLLLDDRDEALRENCETMAKRFAETKDPRTARLTVKACLLVPGLIDPKQLPVEPLVKATEAGGTAWDWGIRGMLAYRTGDAKNALEYLEKAAQRRPVDFARAADLAVGAMAEHDLGNEQAAKQALEQASELLEKLEAIESNRGHHDLLIAQILFKEASEKINGEK